MRIFALYTLILLTFPNYSFAENSLPNSKIREAVVRELAAEMNRLDGEALFVRKNRSVLWGDQVQKLSDEANKATTWKDFLKTLNRLNYSYPNLHSSLSIGKEFKKFQYDIKAPTIKIASEWISRNKVKYIVSDIDDGMAFNGKSPSIGDEIIAINGIDISRIQDGAFEFCKFPLKAQCDFELPLLFFRNVLSWSSKDSLNYTLKRNNLTWIVPVELKNFESPSSSEYCSEEDNRYSGFKMVYSGNRACVYVSDSNPDIAILRITSFYYGEETLKPDEEIDSVEKEVHQLYLWWKENATWDQLFVDLIDNHGGNSPIDYYRFLLHEDFQEQYVRYKKIPEMENDSLRRFLFWGEQGLEYWFQNIVANGLWGQLKYGEFTSHTPMFCADDNQDCTKSLFSPWPNPFHGKVSVLINHWCVSACDGFAYNLKEKFNAKFYGQPQAADTGYARLKIRIELDENLSKGFRLSTVSLFDEMTDNTLLEQTVVVSRSVNKEGETVSGRPVPINKFVPLTLENRDFWPDAVLQIAIESETKNK